MVKSADARQCDDVAVARRLHDSGNRRVLLEPEVRAVLMEVVDVCSDDSSKLVFVEDDHMVKAISSQATDPPFGA